MNFLSTKKYIFLLCIAVVLVVAAVWYWRRPVTSVPIENGTSGIQNASSSSVAGKVEAKNSNQQNSSKGLQITPKPVYRGEPVAVLIEGNLGGGFSESYKAKLRAELGGLAKKVASGDGMFDDWMRIGVIKKIFRDFAGARDAWEYAGSVYTLNPLPFYNLGDLYGSYLKDFPRAESAFQHVIKLDSKQGGFYTALADLYRYFYTAKKDLVVPTVERGLQTLPNDANLLLYLGSYYRDDVKDTTKAIFYYEKVLAQDPGNIALKSEIDRLKSLQ